MSILVRAMSQKGGIFPVPSSRHTTIKRSYSCYSFDASMLQLPPILKMKIGGSFLKKLVGIFLCLALLLCGVSFLPRKTAKTVVLSREEEAEMREGMYALSP